MGVIRVLPPALVNRIAAGECVERPASVVKELVENALDAGATRVEIATQDGGRDLIEVRDDGVGIARDDLPLAVHPHATSKLRDDDGLFDIHTMGFRGEALASIGSVSRLRIVSRVAASDVGYEVRVDGGEPAPIAPCAAPVGTTVQVRDLFYCVPARRKFLKTNATESGHVGEQLARIALAHPQAAFVLRSDKRVLHDLPSAASPRQRISDLFGEELAEALIPIQRESHGVHVEGLVVPPQQARGSSKWEYVLVNGRYVRDRFVSHAIKESYRSLIDPSRFPVAFLWITLPTDQVDVNVHPTKIEVRWRDSNFIHAQVLAAIREQFLTRKLDHRFGAPDTEARQDAERDRVRQAMVDFFTQRPDRAAQSPEHAPALATSFTEPSHPAALPGRASNDLSADRSSTVAAPTPSASEPFVEATPAPPTVASAELAAISMSRAIQVHNTYLIVETSEGVMIIDQHALHERILYEELQRRITHRPLESQRLLLPEVVRIPPDRMEALESHAETLARLGIELAQSGPQSVTLHAFPTFLERVDRAAFVRDVLDLLAQPGERPSAESLLHRLIDMMACKAAVKAGDALNSTEIESLLERRVAADRSSHCPHGRPTTLHLSLPELERQFRRR